MIDRYGHKFTWWLRVHNVEKETLQIIACKLWENIDDRIRRTIINIIEVDLKKNLLDKINKDLVL